VVFALAVAAVVLVGAEVEAAKDSRTKIIAKPHASLASPAGKFGTRPLRALY
jgi:hypothetical protein